MSPFEESSKECEFSTSFESQGGNIALARRFTWLEELDTENSTAGYAVRSEPLLVNAPSLNACYDSGKLLIQLKHIVEDER
jgi:hypothetical protein